jgi:hypothetical protein
MWKLKDEWSAEDRANVALLKRKQHIAEIKGSITSLKQQLADARSRQFHCMDTTVRRPPLDPAVCELEAKLAYERERLDEEMTRGD